MNAITTFKACAAFPALPAADLEIAKDFARASKAAATRRAYQKDFARFTAWCEGCHECVGISRARRRLSGRPGLPSSRREGAAAPCRLRRRQRRTRQGVLSDNKRHDCPTRICDLPIRRRVTDISGA
jgi:hypothetical protein